MLRFVFKNRHRNLPSIEEPGSGPQGRINRMRQLVTDLVRHERIEGAFEHVDESRGYAERLIQLAQKHGDQHKQTMEIANFWLLEKDLIHKLFKVLVPRYQNYQTCFTNVWHLPTVVPGPTIRKAVLELKGNPWPPVVPHVHNLRGTLINVLLEEARKDYRRKHRSDPPELEHTQQMQDVIASAESQTAEQAMLSTNTMLSETLQDMTIGTASDKDDKTGAGLKSNT